MSYINKNLIKNRFESLVKYVGSNLAILMVSETKTDDTFREPQFSIKVFQHLIDLIGQLRVGDFCST